MAKQRSGEREAFWREQVRRQAASWLSVRRFCEEKGLSEPSFCRRPGNNRSDEVVWQVRTFRPILGQQREKLLGRRLAAGLFQQLWQFAEDASEVGEGLDPPPLAGCHEAEVERGRVPALFAADEEPVSSSQSHAP